MTLTWEVAEAAIAEKTQRGRRGSLRRFLAEVVANTISGEIVVTEEQQRAGLAPFAEGPLYRDTAGACAAGRRIEEEYNSVFGGRFEWWAKNDQHRGRLMIRFIPDEAAS